MYPENRILNLDMFVAGVAVQGGGIDKGAARAEACGAEAAAARGRVTATRDRPVATRTAYHHHAAGTNTKEARRSLQDCQTQADQEGTRPDQLSER